MARSKQYAERVNILKKVRVGGVWKLSAVLERNGKIVRDHVLISGAMSTILKGATTWSGTRRESEGAKRLATSRKFRSRTPQVDRGECPEGRNH